MIMSAVRWKNTSGRLPSAFSAVKSLGVHCLPLNVWATVAADPDKNKRSTRYFAADTNAARHKCLHRLHFRVSALQSEFSLSYKSMPPLMFRVSAG